MPPKRRQPLPIDHVPPDDLHPDPANPRRVGGTVLDLFLGSGNTLIACERTGRIYRAMEIDPRYGLTAVRRWEALTGNTAQRHPSLPSTGKDPR